MLTESVVLASVGAVLGLAVAKWMLVVLKAGVPAEMRHYMAGWEDIGLSGHALGFALAAALGSGIVAGAAPALRCLKVNLTDSLKEGGPGLSAVGRSRWRSVLVAGEIALATVLLTGSVLMVRGFRALAAGGTELHPTTILTMRLALGGTRYRESHQVANFYRELLARAAAIPGVRSAVAATGLPYSRRYPIGRFAIEGREPRPGEEPVAAIEAVTPNYFRTMFVPLRSGRLFSEGDGLLAAPVAVVSARAARTWWPNEGPIGRRIQLAGRAWATIVGVVGDIPYSALSREPGPTVYVPFAQAPDREMDIGLRLASDAIEAAPSIRAVVRALDPELPVTNLNTMDALVRQESFALAFMAGLMGVSGLLALILSAVGVYGVMAYSISARTHETGIRMALGARRGQVIGMLFRGGIRTTLAGLAFGLIPAWGLARAMQSFVWGVRAADAAAFVGVPLLLVAAASLAIYIPAVRATRIDPIRALHNE
jgi:putative ABC transport system permease protein